MQQAGKGTEHSVAAAVCPRLWDTPRALYLQLGKGYMSRDYPPWLEDRVVLLACLGMISSETARRVSQTITNAKPLSNTNHSQENYRGTPARAGAR